MINAADLDPFFHPAMSPGATSPRDTAHLGGMLEVGLHFRNSCQHDHGLASLIFRSRSDLIAGQIEGDAISLIGGRSRSDLIAGQIEGDAFSLIGVRSRSDLAAGQTEGDALSLIGVFNITRLRVAHD